MNGCRTPISLLECGAAETRVSTILLIIGMPFVSANLIYTTRPVVIVDSYFFSVHPNTPNIEAIAMTD